MPKNEDALESYYEHVCSITPRTDVLDSDIIGDNIRTKMKRKWYDLFLLSYEDSRTRNYYTSSHVMRMERLKQFRLYKYRLHPFSKLRNFWDSLIQHVILCNKILQHHNTSAILSHYSILPFYIGVLLELIVILDLFVNMNTAHADHESKEVTFDLKKVLTHYCSTKLFIHTASAIPLQLLVLLKYGYKVQCSVCKANSFMGVLRLLSVISLYRVYETTKSSERNNISLGMRYFYRFKRIILFGFFSLLQIINFADTVCLMDILINDHVNPASHFGYLLRMSYSSRNILSNFKKIAYEYVRVFKSLVLFSISPVKKTFYLDLILSLVAYLIANIFYAWGLLECYDFYCCLKYSKDHIMINKISTSYLLTKWKLPEKAYQKMMNNYNFKLSRVMVVSTQNSLIRDLPEMLLKEIKLNCYRKYFMNVPYFNEWPANVVDDIAYMVREEIYLANDVVAEPWIQDGLVIVDSGELAVYSTNDEEITHLIDGDYFGELSLVTDKELRPTYVLTISNSQILTLNKEEFRIYMTKYPDLFFSLKNTLKQKFSESDSDNRLETNE